MAIDFDNIKTFQAVSNMRKSATPHKKKNKSGVLRKGTEEERRILTKYFRTNERLTPEEHKILKKLNKEGITL